MPPIEIKEDGRRAFVELFKLSFVGVPVLALDGYPMLGGSVKTGRADAKGKQSSASWKARIWNGPLRPILGWSLVVLGIAGWILPIVPGWPFLIPGLVILAEQYHWAHRLLNWVKRKAGRRIGT